MENKPFVQVFGGYNSIGGNKIVLMSSNGYGVFLDFGYNFSIANKYYDDFMKPRNKQILIDGILSEMLPWPIDSCKGIYRNDLFLKNNDRLEQIYHEYQKLNNSLFPLELNAEPQITDILISHAHSDHISDIKYLNPTIRLIASKITSMFIKEFGQISKGNSLFSNILSYKKEFLEDFSEMGDTKHVIRKKATDADIVNREIYEIQDDLILTANDGFKTRFVYTDHSIPGSGAYFIKDILSGKKIIYSGDIRNHGPLSDNYNTFLNAAVKFSPDVLIVEGTRVTPSLEEANFSSEDEVKNQIYQFLHNKNQTIHNKCVFFTCSGRDMFRLASFSEVAKKLHKTLVISAESYYLIQKLQEIGQDLNLSSKDLKMYLPRKEWGEYSTLDYKSAPIIQKLCEISDEDKANIENTLKENNKRIRKTDYIDLNQDFIVKAEDIHQNPGKYIVYLPFYNFTELFDIRPPSGSFYIISKSEPWDLEGEIEQSKLLNWLKLFQFPEENIQNFHCSGHASKSVIFDMIRKINPKMIIPIHTEHPELFETELSGFNIMVPEKGKKYYF